jgi:hypothetical protein
MANDNDDGWVYLVGHINQLVMVEFMSFLHGAEDYAEDTISLRENSYWKCNPLT